MSTPNTFENFLRVHDEAVYNWFDGLLVDYGSIAGTPRNGVPILRVFSSPDRVFAKSQNILQARGWITGELEEEQNIKQTERSYEIPPLPLISIARGDPIPELELAGVPKRFRTRYMNPTTGQWEVHPWPGVYRCEYQVTFWSSKVYTDSFLREWIYGKLGKLGALDKEVFISVKHDDPWGTLRHSMLMEGMSDASDFEGTEQRYRRFETTLNLRMLMFKVKDAPLYPVDRIGVDAVQSLDGTDGPATIDLEESGRVDTMSMNLFPYPLTPFKLSKFPVTGTGLIKAGTDIPPNENRPNIGNSVRVCLTGSADSVEVTRWFLTLPQLDTRIVDVYGTTQTNSPIAADVKASTILSVSFRYKSTQPVLLTVNQIDPTTGVLTPAYKITLPAQLRWKRVHFFTLLYQTLFDIVLSGVGSNPRGSIDFYNVVVRNLNSDASAVILPTSVIDNTTNVSYQWLPLSQNPVLVFGRIVSTSGPVQFLLQDDISSPSFTAAQAIDSTVNKGVVGLTQPIAGSIKAVVPEGTSLLYLVAQPYSWSFNGHEI